MWREAQPKGSAKNGRRGGNQHQPTRSAAQKWRPSNAGTWRGGRTRRHKAYRARPKGGCLCSLIMAAEFDRGGWRAQPAREMVARPHAKGNGRERDTDGESRRGSGRNVRLADEHTAREQAEVDGGFAVAARIEGGRGLRDGSDIDAGCATAAGGSDSVHDRGKRGP